jgi:hypothetical protein
MGTWPAATSIQTSQTDKSQLFSNLNPESALTQRLKVRVQMLWNRAAFTMEIVAGN